MFKKILSLLLCITLCASCLPFSAFAEEENGTDDALEAQIEEQLAGEESQPEPTPVVTPEPTVAPAPVAVRVSFNCTPAETLVWVYAAADEGTELEPEEDGSFLLTAGDYVYVAFCEGYVSSENVAFTVKEGTDPVEIPVVLEAEEPAESPKAPAAPDHDCEGELEQIELDEDEMGWRCPVCGALFDAEGNELSSVSLLADNIVASGTCGDNLTWVLDDVGLLTISGNGQMYDYSSRSKASWYEYNESITAVNIGNGVSSIGAWAFYDLDNFSDITIPSNVSSIGAYAFAGSNVKNVTISDGVNSIGEEAFNSCMELTEIVVDEGNANYCSLDGVLFSKDKNTLIKCPAAKSGEYTIPSGVVNIEKTAFQCCNKLTGLHLPDSLRNIGESAFYSCYSLESLLIPEGVTSIPYGMVSQCNGLKNVSIPSSVTSIGERAFMNCESLTQIKIPAGVTSLPEYSLYGLSSLTEIVIPASVSYIGPKTFENCNKLASISFEHESADPLTIEASAFYSFNQLATTICISDKENINPAIRDYDWAAHNRTVTYESMPVGPIDGTFNGSPAQVDANGNLLINETNFPDANFRSYITEEFDTVGQGYLTKDQVAAVTAIDCSRKEIASLKGIEYFTALTSLECYDNQLTSLDVSNCNALTSLNCSSNQLTSLDVSNNTALTSLNCSSNQLTSLDVSNNTALTSLNCNSNQLTSLDVSSNTALTILCCYSNQLTSLDVSGCTALTDLSCYSNQLTSLDVSGCTALTHLYCYSNQLTTLDVSGCTALTQLSCYINQLTTLDVSGATALTGLACENNQLTTLDVSGCTALTGLRCNSNQLTTLDVSGCTALTDLTCEYNQLTTLDVSGCTALTQLSCYINQLTSLDLSSNTALTALYCSENQLTTLDVRRNTALTRLWCHSNQLTSLDVIGNAALTHLYCYSNQLTSLDLSGNTKLTWLECGTQTYSVEAYWENGQLLLDLGSLVGAENLSRVSNVNGGNYDSSTGIVTLTAPEDGTTTVEVGYEYNTNAVVSRNTMTVSVTVTVPEMPGPIDGTFNGSPAQVDAAGNLLINATNFPDVNFLSYISSSFDSDNSGYLTVSDVADVTRIYCPNEEIASLKGIEYFTVLTELYCGSNQLTGLDVSRNTALTTLWCYSNQLTGLDVSRNTALTTLYCYSNQLTGLDVSRNTALTTLYCYSNQLTGLDVSRNTALTELQCGNNQLTELDVSRNTALTTLYCTYNKLTSLDVSCCTALTKLECYRNQLTSLDVRDNAALIELKCNLNQLTSLDVSCCTALARLECGNNQLTELGVSSNTALKLLSCWFNQLTELDVSRCTALTYLNCDSNQLTSLNVSRNTALTTLYCDSNQLTSLNVSRNTALKTLYCGSNQLTALDLSKNTALTDLSCRNQFCDVEAYFLDGKTVVNLGAVVGQENLDRVRNVGGGSYDATTGIVTLTAPENETTTVAVSYYYNTKAVVSPNTMSVTLIVIVPECSHIIVIDEAEAATCTTAGKTEGSHCSVCGEVIVAQTEIPATGHTEVTDSAVAATCTTEGKTEGSHCSVCNAVIKAQTTIPATGHTEVTDPAVAATCTTAGKTEGSHCSACGEILVAQEVIPATGHNFGEWTETKAPSLTEDGEETRSCQNSGCNETETRAVKAVIYTITYDANGGSGAPAAQQKLKGTALTLSTTKPTLNGFTFKGWALTSTATTAAYTSGASYTEDADATLYAVWEKDVVVDENTQAITVSSVKAYPGSTVDVTVSLQNNPGIVGMTLKFAYDSSAMELTSITESGLEGTWIKSKGVTWANSLLTDNTYNGVILTLTFNVYDTATAGDYEVRVLYEEGDICNVNEEDVNFVSVPGKIAVKNRIPGDTNGDDKVNTKDFITLMKLLAGEDVSLVPGSADINGDGKVNTKDFIVLMKYLAGEDVTIH